MIVKYGGVRFTNATVELVISSAALLNAAGLPWAEKFRWDLTGKILISDASQPAMKAQIEAVERCFQTNGLDLQLLQPDGVTPSAHQLLSRRCLGGTIVVQKPNYPDGKGYQHGTFRTWTAAIEGTVVATNPSTILREFTESITFTGGGPRFGHLEPLTGLPVKQQLKENTIYHAQQSGHAIGIFGFPPPSAPIWPDALIQSPTFVKSGPERIGNDFTGFSLSWVYVYEDASVLIGQPNRWVI